MIQITVGVAFFTAWVSIEEFVINRNGLWKYMPFYKATAGCVWDLAVAAVITFLIWRASRQRGA